MSSIERQHVHRTFLARRNVADAALLAQDPSASVKQKIDTAILEYPGQLYSLRVYLDEPLSQLQVDVFRRYYHSNDWGFKYYPVRLWRKRPFVRIYVSSSGGCG